MKFIEGSLENLAKNRSVIVSLRLLPKLFMSFQQYRGGIDTHEIVLWADKERQMLKHFFLNLNHFFSSKQKFQQHSLLHQQLVQSNQSNSQQQQTLLQQTLTHSPLQLQAMSNHPAMMSQEMHSLMEEIQTRFLFLSFVFSSSGSPEEFRLSREQVDVLWSTLTTSSPNCADELFNWLLNQVRSRDQHGLGIDMLYHILIDKLPRLSPDSFSMMALELLQNLSGHLMINAQQLKAINKNAEVDSISIRQLWDIALRAANTDVSMAAIRHLNSYYIYIQPHSSNFEKEEEFIKQCMDYLLAASKNLSANEEKNLTIIQRAVMLLKTHLLLYNCRYSFHLRRWQLAGDASLASHQSKERTGHLFRINCQPAIISEKVTFELQSTDYVGELRAEVQQWWEQLLEKYDDDKRKPSTSSAASLSNITRDGPLRLLTQGQELTHDLDEKSLSDLGFKVLFF